MEGGGEVGSPGARARGRNATVNYNLISGEARAGARHGRGCRHRGEQKAPRGMKPKEEAGRENKGLGRPVKSRARRWAGEREREMTAFTARNDEGRPGRGFGLS
jgi:hypothetical protein